MDITTQPYTEEQRRFLSVRFANGEAETTTILPGDTVEVDSIHIYINKTSPLEHIVYDRGGEGVVAYRDWTTMVKVPAGKPGTALASE